MKGLRPVAVVVLTSVLAGCSSLPGYGPSAGDVVQKAEVKTGAGVARRYDLVDITPAVIAVLRKRKPEGFAARFGDYRPSTDLRIGVGDQLAVTIWESGSNGLFSPSAISTTRFSNGANSSTIPLQTVSRNGTISVPYGGEIPVVGRTTEGVQAAIRRALEGKAIQPQVLVRLVNSTSNTVTVTGEGTTNARVPLSQGGDRILDVLAEAGSAPASLSGALQGGMATPVVPLLAGASSRASQQSSSVNETTVRLSRGTTTVSVPMSRLVSQPRENIYVRPGDVLTLVRGPESFTAFGAAGASRKISFVADSLSLAEALAKAGGLLDNKADASGVFVFRYEPPSVARAVKPGSPIAAAGWVPVVYRLDMHDPASLFTAQSFPMFDKDVLYISNAPVAEAQKAFQVFDSTVAPLAFGASIATLAD